VGRLSSSFNIAHKSCTTNFRVHRGKNVGIQTPKLSKFRILARNLYLRGDTFAIFLRNSQLLYASIGSFKFLVWSLSRDKHPSYKHFPAVGAFSHKFSIAPSGETTDRIKKSWGGVQKRDSFMAFLNIFISFA